MHSFQTRSRKPRKSPVSFDLSVRPSLRTYQRGSHWTDLLLRTLTKIFQVNLCLVNMGQTCRAHYKKSWMWFIMLAATYLAQQCWVYIAMFLWQLLLYLRVLHCWQLQDYVSNTKGTRCYVVLPTVVTRRLHRVTLHVQGLFLCFCGAHCILYMCVWVCEGKVWRSLNNHINLILSHTNTVILRLRLIELGRSAHTSCAQHYTKRADS